MTLIERAAYNARTFRKQVAAETLAAFAESAKGLMLTSKIEVDIPSIRRNNHKSVFGMRTMTSEGRFPSGLLSDASNGERDFRHIRIDDESREDDPQRHRLGRCGGWDNLWLQNLH
jgi:hypothetical protein